MKIALLFVGFGNVARRFVHLLEESRAQLAEEDVEPIVVGIVTKRHGSVYERAGLDAVRAAHSVAEGDAFGPASSSPSTLECLSQLRSQNIETRVLVETTPLDIQSGRPAIDHVRAAFAHGVHVVTANKGPIAFAYRDLEREALDARVEFLFEGAVMDGIPIFSFVRETLPAVLIRGFRGVLNSTTNYILTAMSKGEPFDRALGRMQAEGIAEADASLDVEGWDAAAKAAGLANVLMDAAITPHDVQRTGISAATAARVASARASGRQLKLVASARQLSADHQHRRIAATVQLEELPSDDPLAALDDQGNALELDTWPLGRIVITQRDAGLEKTAYALLSDLITIRRRAAAREARLR